MSETVIEGFFARLGFQVDSASEKHFTTALERATLKATLLADAIEGAAKGIAQAVAQIAANFEAIGYAANRTHQSVTALKSMGYAVSQLGGSYDAAIQSMENFAEKLRDNPGYEARLKQFGIQTRDARGQLKATEDLYKDFMKFSARQPYYLAKDYAMDFGIDLRTFQIYREQGKEIEKFEKEHAARAKAFGLDADEATKAGKAFMQSMRGLTDTASIAADKFYSDLAPALTRIVEKTQAWIDAHPEEINRILDVGEKIVIAFAHAVEKIATAIEPVLVKIAAWAGAIDGKDGLQEKLDTFATWLLGVWLVRILAAFTGVSTGWAAMMLRLGIPIAIGAAAMDHTLQTPEQYKDKLEKDPEAKNFDEEKKQQREGVRNYFGDIFKPAPGDNRSFWERTMPKGAGGKDRPPGVYPEKSSAAPGGSGQGGTGQTASLFDQPLSNGEHPILDLIAKAEGTTRRGYNDSFAHQLTGDLTSKTFEEIEQIQRGMKGSSAIGRYQFMRATLFGKNGRPGLLDELGIDRSEKFDAAMQDRLALALYNRRMRQAARAGGSDGAVLDALANEWASFPNRSGAGQYPGQYPSIGRKDVLAAVEGEKRGGTRETPPVDWKPAIGAFGKDEFSKMKLPAPPAERMPLFGYGDGGVSNSTTNNHTINASPNVNVTIHGAGDAHETGNEVRRAMGDINKATVRDVQSAIR